MNCEDFEVPVPGERQSVLGRRGGATDGDVVVYFHGTPESRLTIDIGASAARANGLQLVSFDRPGYGGSEPRPFSFLDVAHMAEAAAKAIGPERFYVLGHSGGGPFALATAALCPDSVLGAAVSASPGEYQSVPGAWDRLSEVDREAIGIRREDPDRAIELLARDFISQRASLLGPPLEVLQQLRNDMVADRRVLCSPDVGTHFVNSLQEGVKQGVMGSVWDNLCWLSPWTFELSSIHCPTFLFYGALDSLMSSDYGVWLKAKLPDGRLTVWADEGHLGLLTRWNEVLTNLTDSPL